jgi:hypothetical protein
MARCVVHSETGKDQGKTLARRGDIDAVRPTLFHQTDRLIRKRGALRGVEDLKHRGDLVGHRRENGILLRPSPDSTRASGCMCVTE